MGLLYVFPVSEEETDFVVKKDETLILKTYGLPYIFWIYAICSVAVVFFMFLAIKEPILKLVALGEDTDATLGYSLLTFVGLIPVFIFAFFFYEKRITRKKNELGIEHRVFGIKAFSEKFLMEKDDQLEISNFIDSPNIARMKNTPETVGFQNRGYFTLHLKSGDGKKIMIDRHNRKVDLEKLRELLLKN
ncbi:MAG: hypothetical protein V4598_02850 [Bdellovibrionota bacterium]